MESYSILFLIGLFYLLMLLLTRLMATPSPKFAHKMRHAMPISGAAGMSIGAVIGYQCNAATIGMNFGFAAGVFIPLLLSRLPFRKWAVGAISGVAVGIAAIGFQFVPTTQLDFVTVVIVGILMGTCWQFVEKKRHSTNESVG
jgi:hypothetical protein